MTTTEKSRRFGYLLNAFEHASQSQSPGENDYAGKRRALFDYVAMLEHAARNRTAEGRAMNEHRPNCATLAARRARCMPGTCIECDTERDTIAQIACDCGVAVAEPACAGQRPKQPNPGPRPAYATPEQQQRIRRVEQFGMRNADAPALRELAERWCGYCAIAEDEGGIPNHCDVCCRWITARLWALVHGLEQ